MIKYAYIMKSVIAFMLLWIGANTDYNVQLPAPKIIMLPHAELVEAFGNKSTNGGGTLKAFYKPSSDTIYLEDDFNIHDPWKKAILFHELFHYVQDQNGFRPKCVQERCLSFTEKIFVGSAWTRLGIRRTMVQVN